MTTSEDRKKFDMGKMARAGSQGPESTENREIVRAREDSGYASATDLPARAAPNILESSDNAWLEGTRGLQRNLIRQLQEAKASWSEGRLIGKMRQQVIAQVTEQYVEFLREEARLTSQAALQARKSYLERELLIIKS